MYQIRYANNYIVDILYVPDKCTEKIINSKSSLNYLLLKQALRKRYHYLLFSQDGKSEFIKKPNSCML